MARAGTKQALLLDMLSRKEGVTIGEVVERTGWKANTVHSALATLRTSGRAITAQQAGGERRYRLTE